MTDRPGRAIRSRTTTHLILLALILLGFALRVYRLDAYSFWTDEGLTPERAGYTVGEILRNVIYIQEFPSKDTHPPFYYLIIHVTRALLGESDFAYRYPSVLFGVLLIPLLYQFGRRLRGRGLGLVVALLTAVNPLQVYYAQEARMYTLLVLLGAAASYVLWRALSRPDLTRPLLLRYLALYALLAGLSVYTHYTSVFLFALQALFWAWLLWRSGLRWLIIGAAALAVLVAIPLIPYTVPRLFTGAEANYIYVSPLVMLQDVVHFFNLGLTTDFGLWWVRLLDLVALVLLLLGLWAARPRPRRAFLLVYLLAVVLGLMLGSLIKPMYQGVRHIMMGSPAFLLLVGYGIVDSGRWTVVSEEKAVRNRRLVSVAAAAIMLAAAGLSLHNWYTNPLYAKDDFRAMVRYIEQRAGERDAVVYSNAVLLPVHEHYRLRDDIAVTALPVYPQMATGQEPELDILAAGYDRIWFVTNPPADRRDEDKLIEGWLRANTSLISDRLFPSRTTESRVLAFRTDGEGFQVERTDIDATWDGLPALRGADLPGETVATPAVWVDLVWEGPRPRAEQSLRFALTGENGAEWLAHAHFLARDEDSPWSDTGVVRQSYEIPLPPGFPPGQYVLTMRPDGANTEALLGAVEIASSGDWPASPEALYQESEMAGIANLPPAARLGDDLLLRAAVPWDDAVLPGNNLPLTLFWETRWDDLSDTTYRLEIIDRRGTAIRSQESRPGAPWLQTLAAETLYREVTGVYIRPETKPGRYRLRWTLLDESGTPIGRSHIEGDFRVEEWPLETTVPPVQKTVDARFGPDITLVGYDLGEFAPGSGLPLTLVWRAAAAPDAGYVAFIHLISEATGEIVSQIDRLPGNGLRPTNGWRRGEVLADGYTLPVPPDLPSGRYRLNVGLYDPDVGARPPVTVGDISQPDNQLQLATFDIP